MSALSKTGWGKVEPCIPTCPLCPLAAAMLGTAVPAQAQYYGHGVMGGYGGGYMMGPGYGGVLAQSERVNNT